jgi:hypothetical protein
MDETVFGILDGQRRRTDCCGVRQRVEDDAAAGDGPGGTGRATGGAAQRTAGAAAERAARWPADTRRRTARRGRARRTGWRTWPRQPAASTANAALGDAQARGTDRLRHEAFS